MRSLIRGYLDHVTKGKVMVPEGGFLWMQQCMSAREMIERALRAVPSASDSSLAGKRESLWTELSI